MRCGNLTRFDVTRRARVREFVHVDLAGSPAIEEGEVLEEAVEQVRCRWCDGCDSIELVPRPATVTEASDPRLSDLPPNVRSDR